MKIIFAALLVLVLASSCTSQEPLRVPYNDVTYTAGIMVIDKNGTLLSCNTAGPDPEDYFDCKLSPGRSLNEVMREVGRLMRVNSEACTESEKNLLKQWKHSIENIQKALPKPIPQHKNKKS